MACVSSPSTRVVLSAEARQRGKEIGGPVRTSTSSRLLSAGLRCCGLSSAEERRRRLEEGRRREGGVAASGLQIPRGGVASGRCLPAPANGGRRLLGRPAAPLRTEPGPEKGKFNAAPFVMSHPRQQQRLGPFAQGSRRCSVAIREGRASSQDGSLVARVRPLGGLVAARLSSLPLSQLTRFLAVGVVPLSMTRRRSANRHWIGESFCGALQCNNSVKWVESFLDP